MRDTDRQTRGKEKSLGGTEFELLRSERKTLGLEIKKGRLIVRAPLWASDAQIRDFLRRHRSWIESHMAAAQTRQTKAQSVQRLSEEEIRCLAKKALELIPRRAAYYAPLIGVEYGRITIRNQRSRWGSCSAKGNLNFNCLLMLTPPEVIDSVVVHELCHLKEMNHSDRFYAEVLRVFPDYWKWHKWLKENGPALIRRMTG